MGDQVRTRAKWFAESRATVHALNESRLVYALPAGSTAGEIRVWIYDYWNPEDITGALANKSDLSEALTDMQILAWAAKT